MTDWSLERQHRPAAPLAALRLYLGGLTLATWLLMALGSATRVMNAGLACPDWPLCYGQLLPANQMNLQVFLEWFHRLVASSLGFVILALALWTVRVRASLPRWLPWTAGAAVILVGVQGLLGGLTVTELLRFDIVTAHLSTGLLVFSVLLAMTTALLPQASAGRVPRWLVGIGVLATVAVYGQSVLGALVASQWAAHQCFGDRELCTVMNRHLWGILPATVLTLGLGLATWRLPQLPDTLRRWGQMALACLGAQLGLGLATFHLHLQVEPLTVAHQAVGALLLACVLGLTLTAGRATTTQA
ncbi:MAG: heme A synthase [Gloeomargaritaceae cyanobacterium C42_A2020_066]|nr:heme A synthase [Gloeomargaritaceae cyanobacterium C42_A2020_066]